MSNVIDHVAAIVAAVLIMGMALLLNPITIVVMFLINPQLAVVLLILSLVCGLLGALTNAVLGGLVKWKS